MAVRVEKESGDLVVDGFEQGIGSSPHKGLANIQNANIATESGELVSSFARIKDNPQAAITGGTLTASVGDGTTLLAAPSTLYGGQWINVTASTLVGTAATAPIDYLVVGGGGGAGSRIKTGNAQSGGGGGGGDVVAVTAASTGIATYTVTVGAGGAAGDVTNNFIGYNGATSSLNSFTISSTAIGGGGGGGGGATSAVPDLVDAVGANGSSGGGGGSTNTAATGAGGTGSSGGNGGTGGLTAGTSVAGGGGGDSSAGANGAPASGGNGGNGTANSTSGASVTYGGGGGGGAPPVLAATAGTGGTGGGGAGGGSNQVPGNGTNGTANTGGGGGGGSNGTVNTTWTSGSGGSGIVIISYNTGDLVATGGTITVVGGKTIHTFTTSGMFMVSSITRQITLPTGKYYVSYKNSSNKVKIAYFYDPYDDHAITHATSGSLTFDIVATLGRPIAKATEVYATATSTEYRYYILDANGYVWVYDTAVYADSLASSGTAITWILPDATDYSALKLNSIAVLNGWLTAVNNSTLRGKPTMDLGTAFQQFSSINLNNPFPTHNNYAYVGHQGRLYYCDGNYIGALFPDTSLLTGAANVQSYSRYTSVTTTGVIVDIVSGSTPRSPRADGTIVRIPAVFFTDQYGTQPLNLIAQTVYYIEYTSGTATFQVYPALTGGTPVDITLGATGNQYFNTFYPLGTDASAQGTHATVTSSSQRLNLPTFEIAQCMAEIGNLIVIGCRSNSIYPWDQVQVTPSTVISLPETNTQAIITVNQMAYVFAGDNANIYITDGNVASAVTTVPDYCAGVPGTPSSYIEPYFVWGDAAYIAGRVYFSLLDQTTTKAGNCGGVWSFIPTQNLYIGEDVGISVRLENQSSYGTYNGYAPLIIPNQSQMAVGPQYWSAWISSISSSTYGIDATGPGTSTTSPLITETDAIPTGTMLNKKSFEQIELKFATPLLQADSVVVQYRKDLTSTWANTGTLRLESNRLSAYVPAIFEKTQWLQLRVLLTPGTTSSFIRMTEIRIR